MDRVCYYKGERVFPDYTSNIGFCDITHVSKTSLLQCKCGSIIQNMKASKISHIKSSKHRNYIRNNGDIPNNNLFDVYRV